MEYVEGEPLTDILQRDGAVPPERAGLIVRQTAEALAVAHDLGIVHRDLKPDKKKLARFRDGSDCVKVVDFGIAKANVEAQKVTKTGLVVGTPEYMSPEQIAGDPLDGRSDIYALGLVAFTMLTGKLPFPSKTTQESVIMRLTDPPKRLAEMRPEIGWTPAVQAVMDRALQRDAALRYTSANEFGRALHAAVQGVSTAPRAGTTRVMADPDGWVPPTRVSETTAPPGPGERRVGRLAAALVGVAVIAVVALLVYVSRGRSNAEATTTTPAPAPAPEQTTRPVSQSGIPASSAEVPAIQPVARRDSSGIGGPARTPQTVPVRKGGPVTAASGGQSYAIELEALEGSVADSASAIVALRRVSTLRERATLPSDRAALQFVEAKATMLTAGAAKGCAMMRRIRRENLGAGWREQFTDGIQTCEGN
jgi:serine/threonine-protein kinase